MVGFGRTFSDRVFPRQTLCFPSAISVELYVLTLRVIGFFSGLTFGFPPVLDGTIIRE